MNSSVQTSVAPQETMSWVFGNPFLIMRFDGLAASTHNEQLAALIRDLEKQHAQVTQSNRGGWQSEKTLQTLDSETVRTLLARIHQALACMMRALDKTAAIDAGPADFEVVAWGNINRNADYNKLHFHVGGFWSGVYYASVPPGATGDQGAISFRNPTPAALLANVIRCPAALRKAFRHELTIQPEPGMLLLFPSWLEHAVAPHLTPSERISVGFDIVYRSWK